LTLLLFSYPFAPSFLCPTCLFFHRLSILLRHPCPFSLLRQTLLCFLPCAFMLGILRVFRRFERTVRRNSCLLLFDWGVGGDMMLRLRI
jgi:hypothetical protein